MTATPATLLRELDHRRNDGIDVRLLWDARTDRVSLAVVDERSGESLTFGVDPRDALTAFHHPYAYGATGASLRARDAIPPAGRRDEAMNRTGHQRTLARRDEALRHTEGDLVHGVGSLAEREEVVAQARVCRGLARACADPDHRPTPRIRIGQRHLLPPDSCPSPRMTAHPNVQTESRTHETHHGHPRSREAHRATNTSG